MQMIFHIYYIESIDLCCTFKIRLMQMVFLIVAMNCKTISKIKIQEKRKHDWDSEQ